MQAVPRAPKLQIKSPIELAIRGTLAHPIYLAISGMMAIIAGLALSHFLSSKRFHYTGKMLYVPNRVTEPFYVSPDLRNLTNAVYTPVMLEELREKWDVAEEVTVFRERLQFQVSGTTSIDATFMSKDPNQARGVLQDAMESFIASSRKLRSKAIGNHIEDFKREIDDARSTREVALAQLRESLRPHSLHSATDLEAKIVDLRQTVSDRESRIATTYDRQQLSRAQVDSLMSMRDNNGEPSSDAETVDDSVGPPRENDPTPESTSMAKEVEVSAEDRIDQQRNDKQREVALASFENNKEAMQAQMDLERQRLLEAEIRRKQELEVFNAKVAAKQADFERARSLFQRDLISEADYQKTKSELDILLAQRPDAVVALESDLNELNGRIRTRVAGTPGISIGGLIPGMPMGMMSESQEKQTIALLRGSEKASQAQLSILTEELESNLQQLQQLTSLQTEVDPLVSRVESASRTLDRLRVRQEIFEQTSRSNSDELSVVQDAMPMIDGVTSNDKKLVVAGFGATFLALVGPLFLLKFKSANDRKPRSESVFGIPVMGRVPNKHAYRKDPEQRETEMKRLAMRICQRFGREQGVLAIAGSSSPDDDTQGPCRGLVPHVVEHLRLTGKNVAMVCINDRPGNDGPGNDPSSASITKSEIPGETSASDTQGQFDFVSLRQNHDYVVLWTELFDNALQLETAATQSDAAVLVSPKSKSQSAQMQQTITELADLGVVMLGVVVQD